MESARLTVLPTEIASKAAMLEGIRADLLDNGQIASLQFGSLSGSQISKGSSAASVEKLNAELDAVTKKLAMLIGATSQYLKRTAEVFKQTDDSIAY